MMLISGEDERITKPFLREEIKVTISSMRGLKSYLIRLILFYIINQILTNFLNIFKI